MRLSHWLCVPVFCLWSLPTARADAPALTIYNQDFGVVRETVRLDLKAGVNEVRFTETTAHVEPDSVILRDPTGKRQIQILEQNYRNDPVSQELLLSLYEGKTIDFFIERDKDLKDRTVRGKIIRSGYVPHPEAWNRYGQAYYQRQMAMGYGGNGSSQPIIEVDGVLRFGLPGTPLFPGLGDDTILKPTLHWKLETDAAGALDAELAYVTGGMSWEADYNIVAAGDNDVLDLIGWVTIDNQCGREFKEAKIKLMAGDVRKLQPANTPYGGRFEALALAESRSGLGGMPPVTEKAFDEYHLYTLSRPATLRDRETKQVEFVRADGIQSQRIYVYDGAQINYMRYQGWGLEDIRNDANYGSQSNRKVWVMREFKNAQSNQLGMPLPAGRIRFYKRDDDGRLEFTGENEIDHTPKDETIRVNTGSAFDLVGERRRTNFQIDTNARWIDESFEIKVRNHKKEPVEIRVVEHLYRWHNWEIKAKSRDFTKTDAQTIEFRPTIAPDKEETITYTVHYTW